MLSENEPESTRIENGLILTLGLLFIAVSLVSICALSVMLLNQQKQPSPTPQQDNPVIFIPTAAPPTSLPASYFSIRFPNILSSAGVGSTPAPVSEQIWTVTKIKYLGHELDGQRYDLATFMRVDSRATVKAYCMNRGWDTPDIGAEYLLSAGGIFVPLEESRDDPLQRFLMIQ